VRLIADVFFRLPLLNFFPPSLNFMSLIRRCVVSRGNFLLIIEAIFRGAGVIKDDHFIVTCAALKCSPGGVVY
jgi:hypothetical protein